MIQPTDETRDAFIAAAGWTNEPWRFGSDVADGLAAALALAEDNRALATEYTLAGLPEEHDLASMFTIKVAYRGRGRWAALRRGYCLGRGGEWDWESTPSSRTDKWLTEHRFERDEALRLAREALPRLSVRGLTAADLIRTDQDRSS